MYYSYSYYLFVFSGIQIQYLIAYNKGHDIAINFCRQYSSELTLPSVQTKQVTYKH